MTRPDLRAQVTSECARDSERSQVETDAAATAAAVRVRSHRYDRYDDDDDDHKGTLCLSIFCAACMCQLHGFNCNTPSFVSLSLTPAAFSRERLEREEGERVEVGCGKG